MAITRDNLIKNSKHVNRYESVCIYLKISYMPLLVGSISLLVYILTLAPSVTSEDSGELITAAYYFGIPHPPGYPLWTILCGVFIKVVPIGSIAWRANLFSAICSSAAVGIFYLCLTNFGIRRAVAVGVSLSVGFGSVLWSQSVITEVYSLHTLIFVSLMYVIFKWYKSNNKHWLILGSVLVGLGMCNHQTIGLSAVGILIWAVIVKPNLLVDIKLTIMCLLFFVVSLLPYSYLYVRARANPPINWGNPSTTDSLLKHMNRGQYKRTTVKNDVVPAWTFNVYTRQIKTIVKYCIKEYTLYLALISLIGFIFLMINHRQLALLVLLMTIVPIVLYIKLQGIGSSRQGIWSAKVFFIPQFIILTIPLAFGLQYLMLLLLRLLTKIFDHQYYILRERISNILISFIFIVPLIHNYQDNNYRNYWVAYDHANNILQSMLPNALIIPSGDHNTFPLIYMTMVEGLRPDVTIADKYGYIEPELYKEMPGLEGRKPSSPAERREIEEWIIRHAHRPVYYTVKRESVVSNASMIPVGVVYHLLPEDKFLDQDSFWEKIHYRNLTQDCATNTDYGSDNILSDYEFFHGLQSLRKNQQYDALIHFARSADYGTGIKEIFNNIGCALAEHGLIDNAIDYYNQACDISPMYKSVRWNLSRLHKSHQDWESAEKVFHELVKITPDDFRVYGELGFLYKQLQYPDEIIIQYFEKSLAKNPSQPQIVWELGDYYYSRTQRELGKNLTVKSINSN